MLLYLVLLLTVVPFLELSLLLRAAEAIGGAETLLLCLVTGAVGGVLARREGLAVWTQLRREVAQARAPGRALLEAFLVFAGGLLLLTPGIMTDAVGFAMVLPWTRRALAAHAVKRLTSSLRAGVVGGPGGATRQGGFSQAGGGFQVRIVENRPAEREESWSDTETPGLRRLDG